MMSHLSMSNLHYYREALCQRMSSERQQVLLEQSLGKSGLIQQTCSAPPLPAAPFSSREDFTSAIWKHPFTQSASLPPHLH